MGDLGKESNGINVDQYSIVSLNLSTETYNCLSLPQEVLRRFQCINQESWFQWILYDFSMIQKEHILSYGKWHILKIMFGLRCSNLVIRISYHWWRLTRWVYCHCIFLRLVIHSSLLSGDDEDGEGFVYKSKDNSVWENFYLFLI